MVEPYQSPLVARNMSILEVIDHNKETKNEMVNGCESEGGSDRRCTDSRIIGALEINSFLSITAVGTVLRGKLTSL